MKPSSFVSTCLAALLVACASSGPASNVADDPVALPKREAKVPTLTPQQQSASEVRALADRVFDYGPPSPPSSPDEGAMKQYIDGQLKPWFRQIDIRIGTAARALVQHLDSYPQVDRRPWMLLLARMNLFQAQGLLRSSEEAMALSWREKGEVSRAFKEAMLLVSGPRFERAHQALGICVDSSEEGQNSEELVQCRRLLIITTERLAELNQIQGRQLEAEQARLKPDPIVATQALPTISKHHGHCRFSGRSSTLWMQVSTPTGRDLATLTSAQFDQIQLPSTPDGAISAVLRAPLVGELKLRGTRLLSTDKKLSVVPNHLWFPSLAPVKAYYSGGEQAKLVIDISSEQPMPWLKHIPCRALSLVSDKVGTFEPSSAARRLRGPTALYASVDEKPLASVGGTLAGVMVEKVESPWLLVTSEENPHFMFHGWIKADSLEKKQIDLHIAPEDTHEPTHQVTVLTPLYIDRHESEISVAAKTRALVLETDGELVRVALEGLRSKPGSSFWVSGAMLSPLPGN